MISLGITAAIILIAVLALSSSLKIKSFEYAKVKLLEREKILATVIAQDMDRAIRLTGASSSLRPGISNPSVNPPDAEVLYDEILLYTEMFGQVSAPITSWDLPNSKFTVLIDSEKNPESPIIRSAAENKPLYYLKNLKRSNILVRSGLPIYDPGTKILSLSIKSNPEDGFNFNDYDGQLTTLRMVQKMSYLVSNSKQLIRGEASKNQILADNVELFQVSYRISQAFKGEEEIMLPEDSKLIRHIMDPDYREDCEPTNNCATWRNIGTIRIDLEHGIEVSEIKDDQSLTQMGFRVEEIDGKKILLHRLSFQLRPAQFANPQGDAAGAGAPLECYNPMTNEPTVAARCKVNCMAAFDQPSRLDPAWMGYKIEEGQDPGTWSAYCKCAYNGVRFVPLEIDPSNLVPYVDGNQFDHARLTSCFEHYGCSTPLLKDRDPRTALACNCLQDEDANRFYKNNGSEADYEIHYDQFEPSQLDQDNLRCTNYGACDRKATDYYGSESTFWKNKCGCLTRNVNADGSLGQDILTSSKNWSNLCNENRNQIKCSNTWDAVNNAYKRQGADFPQGLTLEDILLCECLTQYGGDYPTRSQNYDFRAATNNDDPNDPINANNKIGSDESKDVTAVRYLDEDDGNSKSANGICSEVYCRPDYPSLGCCTSGPNNYNVGDGTLLQQFTETKHKYYCQNKCRGNANSDIANEINRVRHAITGTPMQDSLPVDCGGKGGTQF